MYLLMEEAAAVEQDQPDRMLMCVELIGQEMVVMDFIHQSLVLIPLMLAEVAVAHILVLIQMEVEELVAEVMEVLILLVHLEPQIVEEEEEVADRGRLQ